MCCTEQLLVSRIEEDKEVSLGDMVLSHLIVGHVDRVEGHVQSGWGEEYRHHFIQYDPQCYVEIGEECFLGRLIVLIGKAEGHQLTQGLGLDAPLSFEAGQPGVKGGRARLVG